MIKMMRDGKDIMEPKFNFADDNTAVYISKSSAYCGGYSVKIKSNISTDKFNKMKRIHKSENPLIKQLEIYILITYPFLEINSLNNPTKNISRSSQGVKQIELSFHSDDDYYAYALGLNLFEWMGSCQVSPSCDFETRYLFGKKMIIDTLEEKMRLTQLCKQQASIENLDDKELWQLKFSDEWKMYLKEHLELNGLSFSLLSRNT